jgi:glycosyltransferase involved in cell wall biosynthesis
MSENAVLLVTYLFPPIGGPGVQRNLKYVKYLPKFNWDPWVLTVKHINYHVYDSSLLSEVRDPHKVIRTGSLDPLRLTSFMAPSEQSVAGKQAVRNTRLSMTSLPVKAYRALRDFVTFPDPQIGWVPFAYFRGLQVIRQHNIKAIVGAMEPISDTLVAYLLSRKTGIPYLIDYRDSWTNDPYRPIPTRFHRWGHRTLERCILNSAAAITVYDQCMRDELESSYPEAAGKIDVLPNGFDPADLEGVTPIPKSVDRPFRIVYAGSLYELYKANLVSLFKAMIGLPDSIRSSIEIVFIGQSFTGAREIAASFGLQDHVIFLAYVPHAEALSYLVSADSTLLFIEPGATNMITGKVFEYMMAGAPIIASIPLEGACAVLLQKAGFDEYIVDPLDGTGTREVLAQIFKVRKQVAVRNSAGEFSRITNTEKLAQHLNSFALSPVSISA